MVLPLRLPYEVRMTDELNYEFVNRDGIKYHLYFIVATVVEVLRRFFQNVENAMIMVCDSSDGKQQKRRNVFNRWFSYYDDGTMATLNAEAGQGDYQLLLSIYFKKENPYKQQLVKAFGELLTRDMYEIII